MSQFWYRHRAAVVAIALAGGVPLATAAPAAAQPPRIGPPLSSAAAPTTATVSAAVESGREVSFDGGGVLGLSCAAKPNTDAVTIPAESTLRVVNSTGHRGTLLLDGAARGEIADGKGAEVLFHRGPVTLSLKPHCVLNGESGTVRVKVVPRRPAQRPPSTPPVGMPTAGPSHGPAPDAGPMPPARRPPVADSPGSRPRGDSDIPARAPDEAEPQTRPAPSPSGSEPDVGTVPGDMGDTGGFDDPSAVPVEPGTGVAAEPMASVEPMTDRGPIGLLAIIASICVLGVSVGAIRAILAQRVNRVSPA